jgi:hypothetical protein
LNEKHATDTRKRAEIKMGELLMRMKEKREQAKRGDADGKKRIDIGGVRPSTQPTLTDLGITKSESSRWQKLTGGCGR